MEELISLFTKYRIDLHYIGSDDYISLERFGITIPYKVDDLTAMSPKSVTRDIIHKFTLQPDYEDKIKEYVKNIAKKPPHVETILTINDKKKLIKERLIKDGII
jgi:hypothetical protein